MKENGNVTLSCHAEGNPKPIISWVREDQGPITITQRQKGMKKFTNLRIIKENKTFKNLNKIFVRYAKKRRAEYMAILDLILCSYLSFRLF